MRHVHPDLYMYIQISHDHIHLTLLMANGRRVIIILIEKLGLIKHVRRVLIIIIFYADWRVQTAGQALLDPAHAVRHSPMHSAIAIGFVLWA